MILSLNLIAQDEKDEDYFEDFGVDIELESLEGVDIQLVLREAAEKAVEEIKKSAEVTDVTFLS